MHFINEVLGFTSKYLSSKYIRQNIPASGIDPKYFDLVVYCLKYFGQKSKF